MKSQIMIKANCGFQPGKNEVLAQSWELQGLGESSERDPCHSSLELSAADLHASVFSLSFVYIKNLCAASRAVWRPRAGFTSQHTKIIYLRHLRSRCRLSPENYLDFKKIRFVPRHVNISLWLKLEKPWVDSSVGSSKPPNYTCFQFFIFLIRTSQRRLTWIIISGPGKNSTEQHI